MRDRTGSVRRARPWTDRERRAYDWNQRYGGPLKSLACAQWRWVRGAWARPDHGSCQGVTFGPCACNCHYEWDGIDGLVRLMDGRVGVCLGVVKKPKWQMVVHVGADQDIVVDLGEPVLLDQG